MSNVVKRKRSLSEREFYKNAINIRIEVTKLMASDKVVPKSYRFLLAVPAVETAKALVDNITRADTFYPNTAHGVIYRRHYLTLAIADCYRILQDLQTIKDIGLAVNLNRLTIVVDMIDREIGLLKGTRKATKLPGDASVEERIVQAQAELERLEQIQADVI